ncbi:MAG: hypothetical protein ACOVOQ_10105 [Flavobacterium sp.]
MKKETAVEWLEKHLNVYFNKKMESSLWKIKQKFEQAKEMEKQQIINSYYSCYQDEIKDGDNVMFYAKQYYNKKYKDDNEL